MGGRGGYLRERSIICLTPTLPRPGRKWIFSFFHSVPSPDPHRRRPFRRLSADRLARDAEGPGRGRRHGRRPREGAGVELPGREAQPPDRVLPEIRAMSWPRASCSKMRGACPKPRTRISKARSSSPPPPSSRRWASWKRRRNTTCSPATPRRRQTSTSRPRTGQGGAALPREGQLPGGGAPVRRGRAMGQGGRPLQQGRLPAARGGGVQKKEEWVKAAECYEKHFMENVSFSTQYSATDALRRPEDRAAGGTALRARASSQGPADLLARQLFQGSGRRLHAPGSIPQGGRALPARRGQRDWPPTPTKRAATG